MPLPNGWTEIQRQRTLHIATTFCMEGQGKRASGGSNLDVDNLVARSNVLGVSDIRAKECDAVSSRRPIIQCGSGACLARKRSKACGSSARCVGKNLRATKRPSSVSSEPPWPSFSTMR
jgi:hypothetical protein